MLDKAQIEQVFVNLLLNALHAVTENGRVTVRSAADLAQDRIEVEVADNGCGIAAEDLKKIFDPFYSTRTDGTGLGLSVSYGIIQNHEGDIQVFSEPGQDTRFKVTLPILVEKADGKGGA
jgi:signal transduction histidine kinase